MFPFSSPSINSSVAISSFYCMHLMEYLLSHIVGAFFVDGFQHVWLS